MKSSIQNEIDIQRKYYAHTANKYDQIHVNEKDANVLALSFLVSMLDFYNIQSILDIGSGTGRTLIYIKHKCSGLKVMGVEPVKELREIGYSKGLSPEELIEGDATNLKFNDQQFDLVCAFGMLHHVREPQQVISEMLRVSKKAIFISDGNNFGQGSILARSIKQIINALGLWRFADFIKTKGKGYSITEGDGLAYSYSVFNNYSAIKARCEKIHLLNTDGQGDYNFYKTASNVALLGIKKP